MGIINYEFKARAMNLDQVEKKLLALNPRFVGEDRQTDTYFEVEKGRLKLREGNIENALIYYERENSQEAKQSNILLYPVQDGWALKQILRQLHGIKVVVDKTRKIYFKENVKIHVDQVHGLGSFIEVEAIDEGGGIGIEKLKAQCAYLAASLGILPEDYVGGSYSDLLLEKERGH